MDPDCISGKMFVCVRVRDLPAQQFQDPSDPIASGPPSHRANGQQGPQVTTPKPSTTSAASASAAKVNGGEIVVSVLDNVVVVHDPKHVLDRSVTAKDTTSLMQALSSIHPTGDSGGGGGDAYPSGGLSKILTSNTASFFDFDRCVVSMKQEDMMNMPMMRSSDYLQLTPSGSQEEVYAATGRSAVKCVLQGVNSCVFACGQTGSGKTYTLFGDTNNLSLRPGVIPLAVEDLFASLVAMQTGGGGSVSNLGSSSSSSQDVWTLTHQVEVAFFEIYQDEIRCLLSRRGPLKLNYTDTAVSIQDLQVVPVQSRADTMVLLQQGLQRRQTGETAMNSRSSRSHAIFQILVTQQRTNKRTHETIVLNSTLNLVDLAGSERQKSAKTEQKGTKEGIHINQSLSTLLRVFHECSRGSKFVNYRDSTLTMVLRENLGGNSKTFMVATISPIAKCYAETISTLQYAKEARSIRNRPLVNKVFQTRENLVTVNNQLRGEVDVLKKQLRDMQDLQLVAGLMGTTATATPGITATATASHPSMEGSTGEGCEDDADSGVFHNKQPHATMGFPILVRPSSAAAGDAAPAEPTPPPPPMTAVCPVLTTFVKVTRSSGPRHSVISSVVLPSCGLQMTAVDREEVFIDVDALTRGHRGTKPQPQQPQQTLLLGGRLVVERVCQKECQATYWLRLDTSSPQSDDGSSSGFPSMVGRAAAAAAAAPDPFTVVLYNGLPQHDLGSYPQQLAHGDIVMVEFDGARLLPATAAPSAEEDGSASSSSVASLVSSTTATLVIHFTDLGMLRNTTAPASPRGAAAAAAAALDWGSAVSSARSSGYDLPDDAAAAACTDSERRAFHTAMEESTLAHFDKDLRLQELEREVLKLRAGLHQNAMALEYSIMRSNQQSRMSSVAPQHLTLPQAAGGGAPRGSLGQTVGSVASSGLISGPGTAANSPEIRAHRPGTAAPVAPTAAGGAAAATSSRGPSAADLLRLATNATPLDIFMESQAAYRLSAGFGPSARTSMANQEADERSASRSSASPRAHHTDPPQHALQAGGGGGGESGRPRSYTTSVSNASFRVSALHLAGAGGGGGGGGFAQLAAMDQVLEDNRKLALELGRARSTVQELEERVSFMAVVLDQTAAAAGATDSPLLAAAPVAGFGPLGEQEGDRATPSPTPDTRSGPVDIAALAADGGAAEGPRGGSSATATAAGGGSSFWRSRGISANPNTAAGAAVLSRAASKTAAGYISGSTSLACTSEQPTTHRSHQQQPSTRVLFCPTAEEVRAHTRDMRRVAELTDTVSALEDDLAATKRQLASSEYLCEDMRLDLDLARTQAQCDNAELSRAVLRLSTEFDAAQASCASLRSILADTEQRLAEHDGHVAEEATVRVQMLAAKTDALHQLARFWKRKAISALSLLHGSSAAGANGAPGGAPLVVGGIQLDTLASLSVSSAASVSGDVAAATSGELALLRSPGASSEAAEQTILAFREATSGDIVQVLETQVVELHKQHHALQDEVKTVFAALTEAREAVQRKEDEKFAALRQQQAAEERLREKFKSAYDSRRIELEKARASEADIARRYEVLLSRKNALLSKESSSQGSLGSEQKRLIHLLQEEVASLTAKLASAQDEILLAMRANELGVGGRRSGSGGDGKSQLQLIKDKMESLIAKMLLEHANTTLSTTTTTTATSVATVQQQQPHGSFASTGGGTAFPPSLVFGEELTATTRFALRLLMDQLKLEVYVVNSQTLPRLSHATAAITRGDATATFQRCLMDVRGVVAEITSRAAKVGDCWQVKAEDYVNLADHRRRKLAQALLILLVWFDHWDFTPKRDYPSYVELVRNSATLLHFARVSRSESSSNHSSAELLGAVAGSLRASTVAGGASGAFGTMTLAAAALGGGGVAVDRCITAAAEKMKELRAMQKATKIDMRLFGPQPPPPLAQGAAPSLGGGAAAGPVANAPRKPPQPATVPVPAAATTTAADAATGTVCSAPSSGTGSPLPSIGVPTGSTATAAVATLDAASLPQTAMVVAAAAGFALAPDLRVDRRLLYSSRSRSRDNTAAADAPDTAVLDAATVVLTTAPPPPPADRQQADGHSVVPLLGPSSIDSSAMRPRHHPNEADAPSATASITSATSPPPPPAAAAVAVGGLSLLDIRASSMLFRSPVSPMSAASARVKVTSTSRRKAAAAGTLEASDRTERLREAVAASVATARVTLAPAGAAATSAGQQQQQQVQSTTSAHDTTKENNLSAGNVAKPMFLAASHRDAKGSTPAAAAPAEAPQQVVSRKQPLAAMVAGAGLQSSRSHHPLKAIPSCVPPLNLSLIGQQTSMSSTAQLSGAAVPLTFGVPPPKLVPSRALRTEPPSSS